MREIKFRFVNKLNQIIGHYTLEEINNGLTSMFDWNELIAVQYTGLKDKNGKEIFEGDIIRLLIDNEPDERYTVIWQEDRMRFGLQDDEQRGFPDSWAFTPENHFIVIGNIYENSELLTPLPPRIREAGIKKMKRSEK